MKITILVIFFLLLSACGGEVEKIDKRVKSLEDTISKLGTKLGDSAIESSRTVGISLNTFSVLLDEYHDDDPKKREKARRIINAAFPDMPTENVGIEFSLQFEGISEQQTVAVDVVFFDQKILNVSELKKALEQNRNYAFIPHLVGNARFGNSSDIGALRSNIESLIKQATVIHGLAPLKPGDARLGVGCPNIFDNGYANCAEKNRVRIIEENYDRLADAIISPVIFEAPSTFNQNISFEYRGGQFAVVLFRKSDLDDSSVDNIEAVHHYKGDTSKRLEGFRNNPYKIAVSRLKSASTLTLKGHDSAGHEYYWYPVPLRVGSTIYNLYNQEISVQ